MRYDRWRTLLATALVASCCVAACGERGPSEPRAGASPTGPSGVPGTSVLPGSGAGPAGPSAGPEATRTPAGMRLPGESGAGALGVAFPPRDESFRFRQELETVYRTGLQRAETSSYVDAEGDLVWTQEYLRYRVNGCGHAEAAARTLAQIDGAGIAPVCGDTPPGVVSFPPRDESYRFRLQLEAQYRDQLRRPPSSTYVDVEGALVWTQEYLRYRVNKCDHVTATLRVVQQIEGRGIGPVCQEPNMTGQWSGTIDMPGGRGFTMSVIQTGNDFHGTYRDIAFGTVTGSYRPGGRGVEFFVYFGDGSGLFSGNFDGVGHVRGTMKYDKISTTFGFEMTRTSTTPAL